MMTSAFIFGPDEVAALQALSRKAAEHPVDMRGLLERLQNPVHKSNHVAQMNEQSIELPVGFLVTFSIETGHPVGTCRHMSMSAPGGDRVPIPEVVWMVAKVLGFVVGIEQCHVWLEDLHGHGKAVNVVQPVMTAGESRA